MTPTRPIAPAEVAQGMGCPELAPLRLGSLFSGFGGLDLAIEEAFGVVETAFVCDIEPGPCKVLAHRFPGIPNLGDITGVAWPLVRDDLGPIDIVAGGSPCQDISAAGRMAGMVEGSRSNLWMEMREAIRVLAPMFVVWENVGAARSTKAASRFHPEHIDRAIAHHLAVAKGTRHAKNRHYHTKAARRLMESRARRLGVPYPKPSLRALGRVLGDLADLGFDSEFIALRAADVGAPHGRLRYFIVAADQRGQGWLAAHAPHLGHQRRGEAWRRGHGSPDGDRAPVALLGTPTTQDAANTAGPSQMDRNSLPLNTVATLLPTPTVAERTNRSASAGAAVRPPLSGVVTLLPAVALLPTPDANLGNGGRQRSAEALARGDHQTNLSDLPRLLPPDQAWGPYEPAIRRWEAIVGPAPTPTKPGKKGRPKLNPEFACWMMGAAPGWVTDVPGVTDNEALRIAGNGVVQQQAVAALELMIRRMTEHLAEAAA